MKDNVVEYEAVVRGKGPREVEGGNSTCGVVKDVRVLSEVEYREFDIGNDPEGIREEDSPITSRVDGKEGREFGYGVVVADHKTGEYSVAVTDDEPIDISRCVVDISPYDEGGEGGYCDGGFDDEAGEIKVEYSSGIDEIV